MAKTVVIVQARIGSNRLPGKVLMRLAGKTVLWHVLSRCQRIEGIDAVCCAIPDQKKDNPLIEEVNQAGALVFRGSETDVLDRYYKAAKMLEASCVIRITSDCPLIDASIVSKTLSLFHESKADYAANNMPPSWPHGLDCEVMTFNALEQAACQSTEAYDREHVTPWIRSNKSFKKLNFASQDIEYASYRWTLDYIEDYEFLKSLFQNCKDTNQLLHFQDIINCLSGHKSLLRINEDQVDRARLNQLEK